MFCTNTQKTNEAKVVVDTSTKAPKHTVQILTLVVVLLAFIVGLFVGTSASDLVGGLFPTSPFAQKRSYTTWDEQEYPHYVRVIGPAIVDGAIPAKGSISYSPLDRLGRAGRATGTITYDMMQQGLQRERSDMQHITPSGWYDNQRVSIELPNGETYHGYFYNRSHLIAKSLGGADREENLITGTRMQNVGANDGNGGMAYIEGMARSFLEANPSTSLYYSATPVYEGQELVARSVIVDVRASDGSLDIEVEVFNTAKGFSIDYATGAFEQQ